ncbi:MAG: aminotransferase class I/II-fold pyridoxal phosphate-dependent enzyme [Atopostipes suicloacalis]|nr:aminotransferase class I/II-fold pyridoxal phosphate-dependent enzyme [Atopostipes suicloacalis]
MTNSVKIIKNREKYHSKKWNPDYIEKRFNIQSNQKIYPLFIADMDFAHSESLTNKFHEIIARDDYGYFDIPDSFYESIISWQKRIHQRLIKKEWIIPANGTIAAMHIVAEALMKGDNFLVLTPVYGGFKDLSSQFGQRFTLALDADKNTYQLDLERFEEKIIEDSIQSLIFCNPHNPSGKVWSPEELSGIVEVCKKHQVKIISDEIHADLLRNDQEFTSMLAFHEVYDKIIVSTSANKTFNLSGLNTSYLLTTNPMYKKKIEAMFKKFHINTNRVGMEFTRIVYESGENWYKKIKNKIDNNLKLLEEILKESDLKTMQAQSGYLVWLELNKIETVDSYVVNLAKDTGVLLETGSRFIDDYQGYIRINLACDTTLLKEAMLKFKAHYDEL